MRIDICFLHINLKASHTIQLSNGIPTVGSLIIGLVKRNSYRVLATLLDTLKKVWTRPLIIASLSPYVTINKKTTENIVTIFNFITDPFIYYPIYKLYYEIYLASDQLNTEYYSIIPFKMIYNILKNGNGNGVGSLFYYGMISSISLLIFRKFIKNAIMYLESKVKSFYSNDHYSTVVKICSNSVFKGIIFGIISLFFDNLFHVYPLTLINSLNSGQFIQPPTLISVVSNTNLLYLLKGGIPFIISQILFFESEKHVTPDTKYRWYDIFSIFKNSFNYDDQYSLKNDVDWTN